MRSIAILTYHSLDASGSVVSVAPNVFTQQMACIAELGYRAIALRDALAYREANGVWPEQSVVLTFDDGYLNFEEHALPVLTRHDFSATVFVVSGYVGGWNDWADPPAHLGTRPLLLWEQIAELAATGIEIGSHGKSHRDLGRVAQRDLEDEIVASRSAIEQRTGQAVESFAYPFGTVTEPTRAIVRRVYRAACTTVLERAAGQPSDALPRVDMYYVRSRAMLANLLAGRLDTYLMLRRWARAIRRLGWRQDST